LSVNIGKPQVVYRETISETVEVEETFDRELGGAHHQARVRLRLIPNDRGKGNMFLHLIPEDIVPQPPIEAIKSSIDESFTSGVLSGYPAIDIKVILESAQTNESQSSEMAFR